ncbi:MAG: hypothetical protein JJE13_05735 [Thermoleophilia bacterium]|nr:hypothetical protein [Thermoleophilia bacterium]
MKKFLAVSAGIAVAAFMSLSMASPASAANETATANLTMTPQSGKLSKTERKAVNWRVGVEIKAPYPASPQVQPMKRVRTTFPKDMTFNPDPNMPVCPDDKVGPSPTNMSVPPDTVIARCPNSVLGNGTAGLYLARANSANGPNLKDPVLIIFNGGENAQGQPKIKIYGYSEGTGAGVFMEGVLDNGVLDVKIPVLTLDSGTGDFNLNIPGTNAPQANRHGQVKDYVQAKCSTGDWLTNAQFTLGTRADDGTATSPDTIINAPESTTPCVGEVTSTGKFGKVKVKGPGSVKKGSKGTYKVTVKNAGSGTITKAKVKASGKGASGSASVGTLKAGKSKTVKVKVKFAKKGKIKTKFKATGKGASAKTATKTVKVK